MENMFLFYFVVLFGMFLIYNSLLTKEKNTFEEK